MQPSRARLATIVFGGAVIVGIGCSSGPGASKVDGSSNGGAGASGSGGAGGVSGGGAGVFGSGGASPGDGGRGGSNPPTGGSSGVDAASGGGDAMMCMADAASDPKNCGACGHVCKNADPTFMGDCPADGCCVAGKCGPSFSPCLTQADVTTCAAYCTSIGETCVQGGCPLGALTLGGWGSVPACQSFNPVERVVRTACDQAIQFDSIAVAVRCCCTDTH